MSSMGADPTKVNFSFMTLHWYKISAVHSIATKIKDS